MMVSKLVRPDWDFCYVDVECNVCERFLECCICSKEIAGVLVGLFQLLRVGR